MFGVSVTILLVGIPFLFLYIMQNTAEEHFTLKFFFLFCSLFMLAIAITIVKNLMVLQAYANIENISLLIDTAYWAFMMVIIVLMSYFFIYFIQKLLMTLAERKKERLAYESFQI